MRYLALGDSISIDEYTGVAGGGAVAQFAKLLGASEVQDLTLDGCTTAGVLQALKRVTAQPDVVTLTAGGNDLLESGPSIVSGSTATRAVSRTLSNLRAIGEAIAEMRCRTIVNTVYDPTDGDDSLAAELGLPLAARVAFAAINDEIRSLAARHRFVLADLEALFRGHGIRSKDGWIVLGIEPNLAGATAIARHWHALLGRA
jgi:lysophospholipase L1-like esterase